MVRVSVGVPVYNGGDVLQASLDCICNQTFDDIEIIICDNASTDQTADVCQDFAQRDRRIRYILNDTNIGSLANFQKTRDMAQSELFMWRAYDDLSDADFIEKLVGCHDANPSAVLAVGQVRSRATGREKDRIYRYHAPSGGSRAINIVRELFQAHASWIYGLWDVRALRDLQSPVHAHYPHIWGWDHLVFLQAILDRKVCGTNDTEFLQNIFREGSRKIRRAKARPSIDELQTMRRDFEKFCRMEIDKRQWTSFERWLLNRALPHYVDKRAYSRRRLWRRGLKEQFLSR